MEILYLYLSKKCQKKLRGGGNGSQRQSLLNGLSPGNFDRMFGGEMHDRIHAMKKTHSYDKEDCDWNIIKDVVSELEKAWSKKLKGFSMDKHDHKKYAHLHGEQASSSVSNLLIKKKTFVFLFR